MLGKDAHHYGADFSVWGLLIIAIAIWFSVGCRSRSIGKHELTISAAISLKDAFDEIADLSEKRTGHKIRFNYGATGALQKQIEAGAPADIFASAGAKQMDELIAKGLVAENTRANFARNELVLIVSARSSAINSFSDLTNASVKSVAIGNPKTVPAGQYTNQTFSALKLLPAIQSKLILGEDVRQVLDYVARDEVDAGVVYSSDVPTASDKVKIVARADEQAHDAILYPIAILKSSNEMEAAHKFVDLVLSSEGQAVLVKHGFMTVK